MPSRRDPASGVLAPTREAVDSESRSDRRPPPAATEPSDAPAPAVDDGRWGELPIHLRDLFRSHGHGGMPALDRDWIDAYHRRLNRER